ncbi:hypothetical protein HanIR_Chr08g0385731 [Helianthus annuus]|nr:hypothetical protein HanIR_Chr08g0385731 [Helianthus annuus]
MSPKVETAFNAKSSSGGSSQGSNSKTSCSSYLSFDPNLSTTKKGKMLQCNIVLNLENDQDYSEEVAKSHMSLLGTVLESYGSLVAGRIGNPMLTKEDYDQIDAEEMELMDIKWCLASVLRRAEKEKGHFKRECKNREASGAQNPFNNNNDYYRKTIYHQVAQQPHQQQPQTAHTRKEIEESSKRACMVNQDDQKSTGFSWDKYISADNKAFLINQDDEKLPEGFSWANFSWDDYDPNKTSNHKAFVARVAEDSDNDDDYYARKMEKHLRLMEESDSDDEKARKKKKKAKTPVSSDDEEVPVIKRKVKEVPVFKVEEEANAQKIPEKCESCETMKKQNSTLIHIMNRLKESYDVLNKAMNMYNETSSEHATAMKTLQGAFMTKQKVVNNYIEKCAALEQKLETQRIETEKVNRLLKSYSGTSYVIDRIYPTVEGIKAFEEDTSEGKKIDTEEETSEKKNSEKKKSTKVKNSGKKQGVSYNKCPPPLENGYSPRNPNSERVEKATNFKWETEPSVNLPENIDVTFTSSDTDQQSQLMKKVVVHVLDNDETEESKSEPKPESKSEPVSSSSKVKQGKRVYNKDFLLSKSNLNDEIFKMAYILNDSDKLYSDEEFPIRGVKTEMLKRFSN